MNPADPPTAQQVVTVLDRTPPARPRAPGVGVLGNSRRRLRLVVAVGVVVSWGCGAGRDSSDALPGAGAVTSETRPVPQFTEIEVRGGIKLELTIGTPGTVEVTAQQNLLAITTTNVSDRRLTVDTDRSFSSTSGITVKVTTAEITALVLVGGATGSAEQIVAGALNVRAEAGATLTMSGRAESLDLTATGGAMLKLGDFTATNATITLAGGAQATVGVTQAVKGSATGGAVLTVRGHPPVLDVNATAGAVVTNQ
jgi:Putative auto-transporter adhesin, head GIN domain